MMRRNRRAKRYKQKVNLVLRMHFINVVVIFIFLSA